MWQRDVYKRQVLAVPSFGWMLPIVFLCGVGTSLIDSMGNSLVIAYMPEKKNTFVPMLHSSHAIGTMVGPMLFPVLMDAAQPETFKVDFLAVAIAGVAALVLFLLAARSFLKSQPPLPMEKQPKARDRGGFGIVFSSKYAWILVIVSICYFFFCWGKNSWLKYFFEREGEMCIRDRRCSSRPASSSIRKERSTWMRSIPMICTWIPLRKISGIS